MFMKRKSTPVKESAVECCSSTGCCSTTENNLRKLVKSGMLSDFVKKNSGTWDHLKWLGFCDEISAVYAPIDYDQVGLALEREKANYFAEINQ